MSKPPYGPSGDLGGSDYCNKCDFKNTDRCDICPGKPPSIGSTENTILSLYNDMQRHGLADALKANGAQWTSFLRDCFSIIDDSKSTEKLDK